MQNRHSERYPEFLIKKLYPVQQRYRHINAPTWIEIRNETFKLEQNIVGSHICIEISPLYSPLNETSDMRRSQGDTKELILSTLEHKTN